MKFFEWLVALIVGTAIFFYFGGGDILDRLLSDDTSTIEERVGGTAESSQGAKAVLNESAEVSVLELYAEHVDGIDELTGGKFPLLLKVRIKNINAEDGWHANPASFTLSNEEGQTFDFGMVTKLSKIGVVEDSLDMVDLYPNQMVEGWISFEPKWGKKFTLTYGKYGSHVKIPIELPDTEETQISTVYNNPPTAIISNK